MGTTAIERIDPTTGEITEVPIKLSAKEALALIRRTATAKESEFEEKDMDWWDPKVQGASQEIRGIYLGSQKKGKRVEHMIGQESLKTKGKLVHVRFNGSAQLTSDFENVDVGTPVLIRYIGKEKCTYTDKNGNDAIGERHVWMWKTLAG